MVMITKQNFFHVKVVKPSRFFACHFGTETKKGKKTLKMGGVCKDECGATWAQGADKIARRPLKRRSASDFWG